jgi:hypothetical protein
LIAFAVILLAYFMGRHFGKHYHDISEQSLSVHQSRLGAVVYARNHHSLPTRPMPVAQTLHSGPTRPRPINVSR